MKWFAVAIVKLLLLFFGGCAVVSSLAAFDFEPEYGFRTMAIVAFLIAGALFVLLRVMQRADWDPWNPPERRR